MMGCFFLCSRTQWAEALGDELNSMDAMEIYYNCKKRSASINMFVRFVLKPQEDEISVENDMTNCMVDPALDVLFGRWKVPILYHLFHGTKRFSELQKGIPNITKKMLTSQLRELEEQDIVRRVVYPVVPPKVEYSLTEYGRTLDPVLQSMHQWGSNHVEYMRRKIPIQTDMN